MRVIHVVLLVLSICFIVCVRGQSSLVVSYNISTFAGGGNSVGDGLPAVDALLNNVRDVACYSGVIVISDTANNRIRKISNGGIISTIAGTGIQGYNGDGIDATNAQLHTPHGIAFHPTTGELYISDYGNHRIRKINSTGDITTIAGTNESGYNADNIPATSAKLNFPTGVYVNSNGEVFIAEWVGNRIRKVLTNGRIITLAGNGTAGYSGDGQLAVNALIDRPYDLVVDSNGDVIFSDYNNHRIRKIYSNGTIGTIVGTGENIFGGDGGPAINAKIGFPFSLALNSNNDLYISDYYKRIRKISNGIITTVAGTGLSNDNGDYIPAISANLNTPIGIAVDSSNNEFFIAERNSNRIRKVLSNGNITTVAGGTSTFGSNVPAIPALISPTGSLYVNSSHLYFADIIGQFRQIDLKTNILTTVAGILGSSTLVKTYSTPTSIKSYNNDLYVMYTVNSYGYIDKITNNVATKFAGTVNFNGDNIPATKAIFNDPNRYIIDSITGEAYISDSSNHRIRKIFTNGTVITIAGIGIGGFCGDGALAINACLNQPFGIALSSNGELYIADKSNNRIRKVSNSGIITTVAGNGDYAFNGDGINATSATLAIPYDVSVSPSGEIYIADYGHFRIRKVFTNGTIITIAGTGIQGNSGDNGLAVNALISSVLSVFFHSEHCYFTDLNCVVRKIHSNGTIVTVAGTGACSFAGDGGQATSAQLNLPYALAISANGEIFISDRLSNRIRKISTSGVITTVAGTGSTAYNGDDLVATATNLNSPTGITMDANNTLYIVENGFNSWRIRRLSAITGTISTIAGGFGDGLDANQATFVSNSFDISNSGEIYIADFGGNRIRKIFTNGTIVTIAGTGARGYSGDYGLATSAKLFGVRDVAISSNGELLIADYANHCIRKVLTNGTIITIAGTGTKGYSGDGGLAINAQLDFPVGISISSIGEIYISETNRIRKILTNGTIFTIAGNGTAGYSGDYGSGSLALVNTPRAVSIGSSGEIYFADSGNNVIRKLIPYCSSNCLPRFSIIGLPSFYLINTDIVKFDLIVSKISIDQTIIGSLKDINAGTTILIQISNSNSQTFRGISLQNTQNGILTLFPPILMSNQISVNFTSLTVGFSSAVSVSISIGSDNLYSSFDLQFRIPPKSPNSLLNLNSTKCSAIKERLNLNIYPWSADSLLLPLTYAITITSSKFNSIRITDFSQDLNRSIVLPYIGESISLGIIVMDSMGNYYSNSSSLSVMVDIFNGTISEYSTISNSGSNFNLITSLIYDTSFSASSKYYASLLSNIDVSGSDTSSALSSVSEIISKTGLDDTIANTTLLKLSELLSYSYNRYNSSKSSNGYVSSKISNNDITSILSFASEFIGAELLISNSRELAENLADLIILGQLVSSLETSNGSLSVTSYSSSNINLTISAFAIPSISSSQLFNQKVEQGQTSVSFNASYIISQNGAYFRECAVSLIAYSNLFNNSSYSSNGTSEGISITTDFKFLKNQKVIKLENLVNPIIIEFKLSDDNVIEKLQRLNSSNYNFTCAYLEESSGIWSDQGCYLYSFNYESRIVQCACNHTTLFTTFLEQKTIPVSDFTKRQVASLYYGQISLGVFYFIISITVLILMIIFRNSQPLSSRLSTPYLGMIALITESLLIYIIQRSVLVDQLFKDSTSWSSGDLASNWIANIVMIFVNTLNCTAIFAYLIQVSRFQLMKYLYNILYQFRKSQSKISQSTLLKNLKRFTSSKLVNTVLIIFAIVNLIYWTLWVILRRTGVISITAYTYIISISYIIIIFALSFVISGISIVDFIYSMIKQHSLNKKSIEETKQTKIDLQIVKEKISSMGIQKWLISMDTPLYFRGEMLLYILYFILLIINQSLGMSTLPFRFENEESYRNVIINDVIAFIFEVVYVAVYILVFGGYPLLIIISNKIRIKLRKVPETLKPNSNEEENREMFELISNCYGREIFEEFCRKEFSVENLYLFLDLKDFEKLGLSNGNEFNEFISRIYNNYIKHGSEMEVNIPSSCSKQFTKIFQVSKNQETEMVDLKNPVNAMKEQVDECFLELKDNIIMNLSDTFSRFVLTKEYQFFSEAFDFSHNNLAKPLNL